MSIFKSEKELIEKQLLEIVNREVKAEVHKNAKWFTIGNKTYVGVRGNFGSTPVMKASSVSGNVEVANAVNSINALNGNLEFINYNERTIILGYLN